MRAKLVVTVWTPREGYHDVEYEVIDYNTNYGVLTLRYDEGSERRTEAFSSGSWVTLRVTK